MAWVVPWRVSWPLAVTVTSLRVVMFHAPSICPGAVADASPVPDADDASGATLENASFGAGSGAMKWMYTNVPPTTTTTIAAGMMRSNHFPRRLSVWPRDMTPSFRPTLCASKERAVGRHQKTFPPVSRDCPPSGGRSGDQLHGGAVVLSAGVRPSDRDAITGVIAVERGRQVGAGRD